MYFYYRWSSLSNTEDSPAKSLYSRVVYGFRRVGQPISHVLRKVRLFDWQRDLPRDAGSITACDSKKENLEMKGNGWVRVVLDIQRLSTAYHWRYAGWSWFGIYSRAACPKRTPSSPAAGRAGRRRENAFLTSFDEFRRVSKFEKRNEKQEKLENFQSFHTIDSFEVDLRTWLTD